MYVPMSLPWKFQSADFGRTTPVGWLVIKLTLLILVFITFYNLLSRTQRGSNHCSTSLWRYVKAILSLGCCTLHMWHIHCVADASWTTQTCPFSVFQFLEAKLTRSPALMRQGFISQHRGEAEIFGRNIGLCTAMWSSSVVPRWQHRQHASHSDVSGPNAQHHHSEPNVSFQRCTDPSLTLLHLSTYPSFFIHCIVLKSLMCCIVVLIVCSVLKKKIFI